MQRLGCGILATRALIEQLVSRLSPHAVGEGGSGGGIVGLHAGKGELLSVMGMQNGGLGGARRKGVLSDGDLFLQVMRDGCMSGDFGIDSHGGSINGRVKWRDRHAGVVVFVGSR